MIGMAIVLMEGEVEVWATSFYVSNVSRPIIGWTSVRTSSTN